MARRRLRRSRTVCTSATFPPWDAVSQQFVISTPIAVHPTATNGHQCVLGTPGYDASGCEHFGVWTYANPTQVIYRWLVADPANPGQLKTSGSLVAIPAPIWTVQPPLQPADPVVIAAQVDPPVPAAARQAVRPGAVDEDVQDRERAARLAWTNWWPTTPWCRKTWHTRRRHGS